MEKINQLKLLFCILIFGLSCLAHTKTIILAQKKFGDYQISIRRDNTMTFQELLIQKNNIVVFREKEIDLHFYFGNFFDNSFTGKDLYSGKDITGNKIPDLVISKWTGGAHCCHFLYIFELRDKLEHFTTVEAQSSMIKIQDLDGDKIPEIQFWDGSIDYQFTNFAQSPKGKVILKFYKDHYDLDTELMKKNTLSRKKLARLIPSMKKEILNNEPHDQLPSHFLKILMTLSYSGRSREAMDFIDATWPPQKEGLEKFKFDFSNSLSHSLYWRVF